MKKYETYLSQYWDTYAWVLLHNHFHLVIRVNSYDDIIHAAAGDFKKLSKGFMTKYRSQIISLQRIKEEPGSDLTSFKNLLNLALATQECPDSQELIDGLLIWCISERFRRFLLGYAKAINKQQKRTGGPFQKPFRRKSIKTEKDLLNVICYVHHNPIHHDLVPTYDLYEWSSYQSYFNSNDIPDFIVRVLSLFGGLHEMKSYHVQYKTKHQEIKDVQ